MSFELDIKNIVVVGGLAESLINFRGPLLRAMTAAGYRVVACAPEMPERVREALAAIGVECRDVPFDRAGINPFRDLNALWALFRLFKDERPDVVLGYTIKPVIYGSVAARLASVPSIFSMITGVGYLFTTPSVRTYTVGMLARVLYRIALGCNTCVFFQNPDDRELFKKLRLSRKIDQTVLINGSGVDLPHYAVAPFPERISFLLIARLLRDKGIAEYVEAARTVKAKYPNVSFKLVGWIDENPAAISQDELHAWIREGVVEYLGKHDDVRPAIADSSVYVLPSYREGTPRTVLEAMAMGRPVVTTDAPGCRETVIEEENGFLVPVKDSIALAQAMERFLLNPDLIEKMGKRSREIAEEKYDVRKVNAVILRTMGLSDEAVV